jgi:hypothetical protein
LDAFRIEYEPGWDKYFLKLDASVQERIFKKILQLQTGILSRHLKHGFPHFVEEVGGYRVCYKQYDSIGVRMICFAGSHKDYEKWYKSYR